MSKRNTEASEKRSERDRGARGTGELERQMSDRTRGARETEE